MIALVAAMSAAVAVPPLVDSRHGEAEADAAAQERVGVLVWNVAGWMIHRGATDTGLLEAVTDSIVEHDPDFVALNELCWNQYKALQDTLRDSGWLDRDTNFARYTAQHETDCGGDRYGMGLFSKRRLVTGPPDDTTLPADDRDRDHLLMCKPVRDTPMLRFCNTHITPSQEIIGGENINKRQLARALETLEEYAANGDTVIVAGDFNAQPNWDRMSAWYSSAVDTPNNSGNTGHYRELDDDDPDQCHGYGAYTIYKNYSRPGPCGDDGKRIDMIFVRENLVSGGYSSAALPIPGGCDVADEWERMCSDHLPVVGDVTVSLASG